MKKILWIVEKQFDTSPDKATWLEMAGNLESKYDVLLLTGYRHAMFQSSMMANQISYYKSLKMPVLNRFTGYFAQLQSFVSAVKAWRPDIVIFDVSNPLLLRYATYIAKKHGLTLILDCRTLPVAKGDVGRSLDERLFISNLRYAARNFTGITYITEEMRQFCIHNYNLTSHQHATWSSGVNTVIFQPGNYHLNGDTFKILYHGSIGEKRRLDCAVRAIKLLGDIDVCLEFLGGGDALNGLETLVEELGLRGRVRFSGYIDYSDVPKWINQGHAGILPFPDWPGWNTSSPIKLFEYLSCGKPVIVTDIPAHKNVLNGCEFAFWAANNSPEELADAIRKAVLARNRFDVLGGAARVFVINEFTWKRQAEKLSEFIENVSK